MSHDLLSLSLSPQLLQLNERMTVSDGFTSSPQFSRQTISTSGLSPATMVSLTQSEASVLFGVERSAWKWKTTGSLCGSKDSQLAGSSREDLERSGRYGSEVHSLRSERGRGISKHKAWNSIGILTPFFIGCSKSVVEGRVLQVICSFLAMWDTVANWS